MNEKEKAAADQAAAEQRQTELAAARAEGVASATAELTPKIAASAKEGATAERARVKTILTADVAKGRPKLAQHLAFNTEMAADAAVSMLGEAGLETAVANPLADAMGKVPNPKVGADGGDGGDGGAPKRPPTSAEVIALRNRQAGVTR